MFDELFFSCAWEKWCALFVLTVLGESTENSIIFQAMQMQFAWKEPASDKHTCIANSYHHNLPVYLCAQDIIFINEKRILYTATC